jgi:hypothetical protein
MPPVRSTSPERRSPWIVQAVKSKLWLVAATFQRWKLSLQSASNRCDAGSEYTKHRSQGPRHRPALRKMRLQNALRLHRTGQTRLRTSRLRMHQLLEHAELCDSALGLARGGGAGALFGIEEPETRQRPLLRLVLFLNQDWREPQSPEKGARAWLRNFSIPSSYFPLDAGRLFWRFQN